MVRTDGPQTVGATVSARDLDGEPRQNAGGPVPSLPGRPQKFEKVVRDILYVAKPKFDKRTYQRELMRRRRAEGKA